MYLYNILSDKCVFKYDVFPPLSVSSLGTYQYKLLYHSLFCDWWWAQESIHCHLWKYAFDRSSIGLEDSSLTVFNVKRKDAIQTVSVNKGIFS